MQDKKIKGILESKEPTKWWLIILENRVVHGYHVEGAKQ